MNKRVYESTAESTGWDYVNPATIYNNLARYKELITSITIQNFRATYQASYLGVAWQVILPLIMLAIFYYVFGVIMGGRFGVSAADSPVDYALALFVGLGFFNFIAQNIGSAVSLIISNQVYVKALSFPVEIISITTVLNSLLTLAINLILASLVMLICKHTIYLSSVCALFYMLSIFLIATGISWALSAVAVFFRDISAIVSPVTIILMFMCPIFYPASMVPHKLKWVININPIAVIIEDVRGAMLYGVWPNISSVVYVFAFSLTIAILGYNIFMRSKNIFADLI